MSGTVEQAARPKVTAWPGDDLADRLDLSDLCVGFEASKTVDSAAGRWSIALAPNLGTQSDLDARRLATLYRDLRPNHVVSLGMEEDGGIMLGLVSRVERMRGFAGARVSDGLRVHGADLGKVLVQDNVVRASLAIPSESRFKDAVERSLGADHPLINLFLGVNGASERGGYSIFYAQGVADVVNWILDSTISMRLPIIRAATGGDGNPRRIIRTDKCVTTWNNERVFAESLQTYAGTVAEFIFSVLDRDFYEVYVDTVPRPGSAWPEVHLVLRPKPFDERLLEWLPLAETTGLCWEDLRTRVDGLEHHVIEPDQLLSMNLGRDDSQAFGWYVVTSRHDLIGNEQALEQGLYYPVVDLYNVRRYGLRSYNARITLCARDLQAIREQRAGFERAISEEVHEFRNRLVNWYRMNAEYEAGAISVPGRDRYRAGDPVYLPEHVPHLGDERGVRFYCTGVTHTWSLGQPYLCNLRLARGHNPGMVRAFRAKVEAAGADGLLVET